MAVAASYLRTLTTAGVELDAAASLVEFRFAATDEQFPTIAKLRAARELWARMLRTQRWRPDRSGPARGHQSADDEHL